MTFTNYISINVALKKKKAFRGTHTHKCECMRVSPKMDKANMGISLQRLRRLLDSWGSICNETRTRKNHNAPPGPVNTLALKDVPWAWVLNTTEQAWSLPCCCREHPHSQCLSRSLPGHSCSGWAHSSRFPWHSKPPGLWLPRVPTLGPLLLLPHCDCLRGQRRKYENSRTGPLCILASWQLYN